MTRKQIDAARELRLWLSQIVIPAAGIAMMVPESREVIVAKYRDVKNYVKSKIGKK